MANPRGNPQNLTKPGDPRHHVLTAEDRKKGAKKAGEVAHQDAMLRKYLVKYAKLKPSNKQLVKMMENFGEPEDSQTNEAVIAAQMTIGAMKGDVKMTGLYLEATGQRIQRNINENHNIDYKPLIDLTKRKKNGEGK